ncbi:16S rRNA (cytosine(967)-C(5))-methyltransferase RsmB [Clostridium thermobutyricum]|uniref:16S rRNA (cytosine(967)-C(5))-methyltransferase n=1 Tax=Clostridium thermobutyricum DSM 4928 TaxID=1121339 RepID=A0A1V4T151_9CLOT|nr:16S rRNA (cytosine(967)-C(5))-methyltransferase RsmB [Clostridium thermobutyricum]OPX51279.1 ribosomal RNA small subunit methyltransferase B [Clostridium thermobutyricum DSM 4928]
MNSRSIAIKVLNRVLLEGAYSNIALSKELDSSNLNSKDKGLVTEIVYGTLRRKRTLDLIIGSFVRDISIMDKRILNILRAAIYQLRFLDKIPSYAACNEAVEEAKKISLKSSKLVNGILRNYLKKEGKVNIKFSNKLYKLAYDYSFEPWLVRLFISQYGENKAIKIMKGLNSTPSITLRVNSLKGDYDSVLEELERLGYNVEEGSISPDAIVIKGGSAIEANELFNEGKCTVQDESAMLVAPVLDLEKEDTVLDICSAPGGKTTHIGEILENTGKVLAFDLHENKLSLIKENCDRLGVKNVELSQMDGTILNEKLINIGDKVLIDVPCSGLGIIRRKPEIKWNKNKDDLKSLIKIQREIMKNSWQYLKSGGVMVYSTCTLNREENEENIRWFLKSYEDAKLDTVFIGKGENIEYTEDGMVTILPNKNMDGFFIAKLKKI